MEEQLQYIKDVYFNNQATTKSNKNYINKCEYKNNGLIEDMRLI